MALPNIDNLTADELAQLLERAGQLQAAKRQTAQGNLKGARAALDRLIGPNNPTGPTMNSLTEVQLYSDEQINANNALAHRLWFQATEQLARILRDVLTVVR